MKTCVNEGSSFVPRTVIASAVYLCSDDVGKERLRIPCTKENLLNGAFPINPTTAAFKRKMEINFMKIVATKETNLFFRIL